MDSYASSAYDVNCDLMAGRYLSIQNVADTEASLSFCEVVVHIGESPNNNNNDIQFLYSAYHVI